MRKRQRFFALIYKETMQILRDPSSLLIAFAMPLILLFIFGYGVSLDPTSMKVGVVIESPSPLTDDLAASFRASRFFDTSVGVDRRQFETQLERGILKGILVVPADFASAMTRKKATVQLIVDGSVPNTAIFVKNYMQGVVLNWAARQLKIEQKIDVSSRMWFNPQLSSRNMLVPGCIVIVMTLVGTLLTALVVAREWERGTMEAIMATPVGAAELLLGKIIPYFILALLSMTICLLLAVFLFDVPFRGSLIALYLISAVFLIPALGQGLLISAATKNQFLASQIALLSAFLPAVLLSGFVFDINSMPRWIQWLTYIVPARYFVPPLQTVFLTGDVWQLFLPNIIMMLVIGFILFALAARSTRKRIA